LIGEAKMLHITEVRILNFKKPNIRTVVISIFNISYEFDGSNINQSGIKPPSLIPPPTPINNAATVNNTPSITPASNTVIPAATTGTTHTIKKGDTLYAIAKANNTTVSNLVKANGFANDRALLLPGKTIKIK
jgi:LysM repeat protein